MLVKDTPENPSFHVVAPSLPGFGFSETAKKKGFALDQYAEVGHKLMLALGYDEYGEILLGCYFWIVADGTSEVTQGGDWGAFVCRTYS